MHQDSAHKIFRSHIIQSYPRNSVVFLWSVRFINAVVSYIVVEFAENIFWGVSSAEQKVKRGNINVILVWSKMLKKKLEVWSLGNNLHSSYAITYSRKIFKNIWQKVVEKKNFWKYPSKKIKIGLEMAMENRKTSGKGGGDLNKN